MFNIGPEEMAVLALIAVIIFGPDKLPQLAKQAAQMIKALRDMSTNARKQLGELSPGLTEELEGLNLGGLTKTVSSFNAKTALTKLLMDDEPDPPAAPTTSADAPGQPEAAAAPDLVKAPNLVKEPAPAPEPVTTPASAWDEDVT
jgi:sec-independent protein translocase protein TatB